MNGNPIGIFDSGVGGLSVARSIREKLPHEDIIYIADSAYAPYGNKSKEFILNRSSYIIEYLISLKAKAVVVACNTVTVNAVENLRTQYSIPIIGVEPGVKPAVAISKRRIVAVLATEQTIKSVSFKNLIKRFSGEARIEVQACPGLVALVENQKLEGQEIKCMLSKYVMPLLEKGADTIVMGCTHFAFLTEVLKDIVGNEFEIINTYQAVAMETSRRLSVNDLLTPSKQVGSAKFLCNDAHENTSALFEKLWGEPVTIRAF